METVVLTIIMLLPAVFLGTSYLLFSRYRLKGSRSLVVLCNLSVFLFLSSAVFFMLEIYFRYFFDSTDSITLTKVSQKWFKKHYITNRSGFRDNVEYSNRIPPGKRRIIFVGDSFAAGQGVKLELRFVNILRDRLAGYEIHCLAIPGWNTADEVNVLKSAIQSGYELDSVVLVYFPNDISDLNEYPSSNLLESFGKVKSQNWFIRNSYALDFLYFRVQLMLTPEIRNYSYDVLDCYDGPVWDKQQSRLLEMKELVEKNGGILLVITFPFMQDVLKDVYPHLNINDAISLFWRQNEVPHLDLLPSLRNNADGKSLVLNSFDSHPSSHAHSVVADAIEAFVANNLANSVNRKDK